MNQRSLFLKIMINKPYLFLRGAQDKPCGAARLLHVRILGCFASSAFAFKSLLVALLEFLCRLAPLDFLLCTHIPLALLTRILRFKKMGKQK